MNMETMQRRRTQRRTSAFITLVIAVLILFFGSFFLLRPVLRVDNGPLATTQRFVGFVELKEFDAAHQLMTPTFQNVSGWHGMLYSLYNSIDPAEESYHVLSNKGGIAQVQFSNESGGYLYLKNVNGRWLVASPNELPGAQQGQAGSLPSGTGSAPAGQ